MVVSGVLRASNAAIIACCLVSPSSRKCVSSSSIGQSIKDIGVARGLARPPVPEPAASPFARREKAHFFQVDDEDETPRQNGEGLKRKQ